ncbi:MAG: hypothetical protein M9894_00610 [Planctomycetes bacterium]|nr:hypothetical protein [Planctomycetota bacterium]
MAYLLAKLGALTDATHRVIHARQEESVHEVCEDALVTPAGTVVLLLGREPPWSTLTCVRVSPWPSRLGTVEQLRLNRLPGVTRMASLQRSVSSDGYYTTDDRGVPCEIGRCFGRDAEFDFVVNYAGWRLRDLPSSLRVVATRSPDQARVCIITPESVVAPRADVDHEASRTSAPPPRLSLPALPPATGHGRVAPRRERSPEPFQIRLRWSDLKFNDEFISFRMKGHTGTVATPLSREIYQRVRAELDRDLPEGAVVDGFRRHDGSIYGVKISGLDQVFARIHYRQFVREGVSAQAWLEVDELASRSPLMCGGQTDPATLLDIPEFFGKRTEAFKRLFAHRDRTEHTLMLPGRGLIVPMQAQDDGPPWYAWETVSDGHATYLFRPSNASERNRMFAWTQRPNPKRVELLKDTSLQADLGFQRRVMHRNDDDELGRWWAELCEAMGIPVSASRGA